MTRWWLLIVGGFDDGCGNGSTRLTRKRDRLFGDGVN